MIRPIIMLGLVPVAVVCVFFVHWMSLARIRVSSERLPRCRVLYLVFSFIFLVWGWILYFVYGNRLPGGIFIPLAMSFSFIGDFWNLQFEKASRLAGGEPLFLGIVSFAFAQLCFIAGFLARIPFSALAASGFLYPIGLAAIVIPAILFYLRVYNKSGSKLIMASSFLYGFLLGSMAAFAISAALTAGGSWRLVAVGAAFFLLSDAVMGETTIHGRHPAFEFQVPWLTYLIAQGLILYGYALLPS